MNTTNLITKVFKSILKTTILSALMLFNYSIDSKAIDDPLYPFHPPTNLQFTSSNLPIVIITLNERMAEKWENRRVDADMKIIWDPTGDINNVNETQNIDYNGKIGIRYRGNSSFWNSDKKPFALRLQNSSGSKIDAPILGIGADSDWALLAPYSDKSMMRDVLLFELMRGSMDYVPTGRFCEVVLNGVYQGVYIMTARVRQGPNRINITKPGANEQSGFGFHLEIDRPDDLGFWGVVAPKNPLEQSINRNPPYYQYKYPDEPDMTTAQKNYIINHIINMEQVIAGNDFKNPETGYRKYIDIQSIADYYIVQEISKNVDGYRLSTPFYKYRDNVDPKFKFSIWDFNISIGIADYAYGWGTEGWAYNFNQFGDGHGEFIPWMFKRLLQDDYFLESLKNRWNEHRQYNLSDERILAKIDSMKTVLNVAQARNFIIWNRFNQYVWPTYYIGSTWSDEITYLKNWVLKRTAWMDSQWISENVNLVPNADFEGALSRGYWGDTWLSDWYGTGTGGVGLTTNNQRSGSYALSIRTNSRASQVITELSPGYYNFKAWVRTQLNPDSYLKIKYTDKNNPNYEVSRWISNDTPYHLLEIENLEITNHFIEISFNVQDRAGDVRLWVDDIELRKTGSLNAEKNTVDNINIYVDRNKRSLIVNVSSEEKNLPVQIYNITGIKLYSGKMESNQLIINDIFTTSQVYIVQVGTNTKKIVF